MYTKYKITDDSEGHPRGLIGVTEIMEDIDELSAESSDLFSLENVASGSEPVAQDAPEVNAQSQPDSEG